jgi:tRNA-dihydrouridine synthase A
MDVTDHHFRTLCRMISKRSVLYTEMVVDSTLKHNSESAGRWLAYAPEQQPLVLQLGGSEPEQMQLAAHIAAAYKYTAVNLNCGCPSDRVAGRGCFGASLMKDAARVAALCQAMATSLPSDTPVTVKCRLGVDDLDSYQFVHDFVDTVSSRAPVRHFIVHARKAWLKGLSPAENRTVPPLWYDRVFALRNDFPHLRFSINGGVRTLEQVLHFLDEESLYGVMLGRAVMEHPWETLGGVDALIYGDHGTAQQTRRDVLQAYGEYVDEIIRSAAVAGHSEQSAEQKRFCGRFPNPSLHLLLKPVMNLFWSIPRSKDWRKMVQQTTEEQSRAMRNGQIPSDFSWATFLIQAAEDTLDSWYLDATWMEEQARKRAASFTASNESCSQETEPLLAMHHALETFASSVLP